MKILLINPGTANMIATLLPSYVAEEAGDYPPLGLMYVAASVKKNTGLGVSILDAGLLKMDFEGIKQHAASLKPDIVGITATTFTVLDALKAAEAVKEACKSAHVCVGGPHTCIYPTETLKSPAVDSVVIGEGEGAFVELANNLASGKSLHGIKGVLFKSPEGIIDNGRRELIADLDTIAFPARELIDFGMYRSLIGEHSVYTTMLSSRGCTHNCLYCYHAFGRKFRAHSPAYMISEVKNCLALGIKEIWFFDDNFTIDRKRALEFCAAVLKEKLKFIWHIRTRIDLVDEALLGPLKAAGCKRISFGIESSSAKTLKTLRKNINIGEVKNKISLVKSYGFETYLDFMIGSPGETKQEILDTVSFAVELEPDYAQFTITTPYPDTDLYRQALAMDKSGTDYWKAFAENPAPGFNPGLASDSLSREELESLLDFAYRKFYFRPMYMLKRLLDIKSFGDLAHKLKAATKIFVTAFGSKSGSKK